MIEAMIPAPSVTGVLLLKDGSEAVPVLRYTDIPYSCPSRRSCNPSSFQSVSTGPAFIPTLMSPAASWTLKAVENAGDASVPSLRYTNTCEPAGSPVPNME